MLISIRGVVLGFSNAWRDGKYSKYRKILIGFPDSSDVPKLWCTVWGKENWGYHIVDDRQIEIIVKCGLVLQLSGELEFRPSERNLSVKSDGSKRGGFSCLGEHRKYAVVKVDPEDWHFDEDCRIAFEVDRGTSVFRGRALPPLPKRFGRSFIPDGNESFVIDGSPVLVDMDPNVWVFDRGSNLTVLSPEG